MPDAELVFNGYCVGRVRWVEVAAGDADGGFVVEQGRGGRVAGEVGVVGGGFEGVVGRVGGRVEGVGGKVGGWRWVQVVAEAELTRDAAHCHGGWRGWWAGWGFDTDG